MEAKIRGLSFADNKKIYPSSERYEDDENMSMCIATLKSNHLLELDRTKNQRIDLFSKNYERAVRALEGILDDPEHNDHFKAVSFVLKGQGAYIEQLLKNKANRDLPVNEEDDRDKPIIINIDKHDANF